MLLRASGIQKTFTHGVWPMRRRRLVLADASLSLDEAEIVGLVGENGSGKSTLMRVLVGDLVADAGVVQRTGVIGFCPQVPRLYERLTVDEHMELFAAAYRMPSAVATTSRDALYDDLGFGRYATTRTSDLSGGTLAKLNLALALLPDPPVLLLDEPYAGFDWDTYVKFWDIIAARRAAGRSALIISHFVVDQQRFDRMLRIDDGVTVSL
ncbi:MAG: ATP-binding cassette domain-containing protein [Candidatus Nanopelagicales bacterium]